MNKSVLNNKKLIRICNKVLSNNYLSKYVYGIVDYDFNSIMRSIDILFKDFTSLLDIECNDERILDYMYDNFVISKKSNGNFDRLVCIQRYKSIDTNTPFISKPFTMHVVLILRRLLDIVESMDRSKANLDFNLSNLRALEDHIIISQALLCKILTRKQRSKKGGESKNKLKGIELAILERLKDRPNATAGELWQYFSKFHGAPDPDQDNKDKYMDVGDYKIYVSDGLIYEIREIKKGNRHKNISLSDGISENQFKNDYVKNAKKRLNETKIVLA